MKNRYTDYMDTLAINRCAIVKDFRFGRCYTLIVDEYHTEDISRDETEALIRPWIHEMHGSLLEEERRIIKEADRREKKLGIGKYAEAKPDSKEIDKLKTKMMDHTLAILKSIQDNRYSSKSKLWAQVNQAKLSSRKQFETSITYLIKNGLIAEVKIGNQVFYPLTEKGHEMITTPLKDRKAVNHFEHDWHCEKIAEQLHIRGYKPVREYAPVEGKFFDTKIQGKPARIHERIDVYAKQDGKDVAYEFINKAFYTLDVMVHKCLHVMEMDELVIVTKTLPDENKAREKIEASEFWKKAKDALAGKIKYRTFNNIF
jgi:predicted transcriptional regulator